MDLKHVEIGHEYGKDIITAPSHHYEKDHSHKIEHVVELEPADANVKHDDVWGDLDGSGPNYRGLGWIRTSVILVKIQFGLGVLVMVSTSQWISDDSPPFFTLSGLSLVSWSLSFSGSSQLGRTTS